MADQAHIMITIRTRCYGPILVIEQVNNRGARRRFWRWVGWRQGAALRRAGKG